MAKKAKGNTTAQGSIGNGSALKSTGERENVSSYFKTIFSESPHLLDTRSNEELLQRWLKDHPDDKEVPERIKANLANVKSVLRNKKRKKPARKQAPASATASLAPAVAVKASKAIDNRLEQLEESIDECLTLARQFDTEALASVIGLLRKARNAVVWKLGGTEG